MKYQIQKELDRAVMAFRHAVTEAMLREAKQLGYTVSHIEVIRYLAQQQSLSLKEIAAYLRITPPSASTLVDTLVKKRIIARQAGGTDRRSVKITLTASGRRILATLDQQKRSVFESMFSKLSAQDTSEFIRILDILSS